MSTAPDQELVEKVAEITGATLAESKYLLSACNNNAESAVSLFFEKGGAEDIGNGNAYGNGNDEAAVAAGGAAAIPIDDNDEVRAPIAPIREQLIGPEDDNFVAGMPNTAPRFVRPSQRVKICPLRDFAREGALMEEQLQAAYNGVSNTPQSTEDYNAPPRRRARAAFVATSVQALESAPPGSSSRLGDLYRPPTDIAYAGTFQAARNRATAVKHWLLVNVQNDNFDSQLLNRDVWANKEVRKLLRKRFILWQIDSESVEGRRFIAFYHCGKLPYVCIIDPRTGEEVWRSAEPKESTLLSELQNFVSNHNDYGSDCEEETPSTSKRAAITCIDDSIEETVKPSSSSGKRPKIMELSEDEQIALAIRNSIRENGAKHAATQAVDNDDDEDANSEFGSVEEFVDDDTKGACERTSFEEHLGRAKDDLTMLKLRLVNSDGVDETEQLRWPSDTQLEVLRLYVAQKHPHIAKQSYKLICAFPRKTLDTADDGRTLKELGLHPSVNIHVSQDD